jgi:hypothetical protein
VDYFVDAMFSTEALNKIGISNIALDEWCVSDSGPVSILECVENDNFATC